MISGVVRRSSWLLPSAVVGALLFAVPHAATAADDDPRVWLQRMNQALATRNYDGLFMHVSDGRVETMRIVHRVQGSRITERLTSMDGSGREFIRNNDELTCYLPDKKTILVQQTQEHGPFLGTLPQFGAGVNEFYQVESLPSTRVLGRSVRVISVTPKDQFRFGYRLWLDAKTAMPLRTQLCDARGNVLEQIVFARLETPETIPDNELAPSVHTEGMRWVRLSPREAPPVDLATFRASELPPGFRLTVSGAQMLGSASLPATHLVYSDGLATVSVFVEAEADGKGTDGKGADDKAEAAQAPMQGLTRVGSGFVFTTVVQGHQVTAVGEVPAQTVEFIAHSVKPSAGQEATRR
jgi:sigma-E factor negative regulatory protein RseB